MIYLFKIQGDWLPISMYRREITHNRDREGIHTQAIHYRIVISYIENSEIWPDSIPNITQQQNLIREQHSQNSLYEINVRIGIAIQWSDENENETREIDVEK